MLVLDVHQAQKTKEIKMYMYLRDECKAEPIFELTGHGMTNMVQPVDINPSKKLLNSHVKENLEDYVRGRITASEGRILFTNCKYM